MGRFKQSFIKQFAQQHFYSLLRQAGECVTLVASEGGPEDSDAAAAAGDAPQHQPAAAAAAQRAAAAALAAGGPQGPGSCLGTLDVRLLAPEAAGYGSRWPDGIPLDGPTPAGYVSNVVVSAAQRGRGLGRQLVAEGVALAQRSWGVRCLYCHVETDNEVGCGGVLRQQRRGRATRVPADWVQPQLPVPRTKQASLAGSWPSPVTNR